MAGIYTRLAINTCFFNPLRAAGCRSTKLSSFASARIEAIKGDVGGNSYKTRTATTRGRGMSALLCLESGEPLAAVACRPVRDARCAVRAAACPPLVFSPPHRQQPVLVKALVSQKDSLRTSKGRGAGRPTLSVFAPESMRARALRPSLRGLHGLAVPRGAKKLRRIVRVGTTYISGKGQTPSAHPALHRTTTIIPLMSRCPNVAGYSISQKPCRAGSEAGTCMFVWECLQSEGRHIGMCVDTFMFGSCCAPRPPGTSANAVDHDQNDQHSQHSAFAPPKKKPPPPYHHDVTTRPPGKYPRASRNPLHVQNTPGSAGVSACVRCAARGAEMRARCRFKKKNFSCRRLDVGHVVAGGSSTGTRPQFVSKPSPSPPPANPAPSSSPLPASPPGPDINSNVIPSSSITSTIVGPNSIYTIRPGGSNNRPSFVSRPPHGTGGSAASNSSSNWWSRPSSPSLSTASSTWTASTRPPLATQ